MNNSSPLRNARHEAFAHQIVAGDKLADAYLRAGFKTVKTDDAKQMGYRLRKRPEVAARVDWLLKRRVEAGTRSFTRRQKKSGDLLARVVAELEDIAFQDVREIADWRREAVTNAEGEVIDVRETLAIRDSKALSPAAAKAVKGVFLKSGEVRLELHDKRAALESLAKILKGDDVAVTNNVTVNSVSVGSVGAMDLAQRVAFLLSAASAQKAPAMKTIDATPSSNQELRTQPPTP